MVYGYYKEVRLKEKNKKKEARIKILNGSADPTYKKGWNNLTDCLKPEDTVIIDSIFDIVPKVLYCEVKSQYLQKQRNQKKKNEKEKEGEDKDKDYELTEEDLNNIKSKFEKKYKERTKKAYDTYRMLYLENINLKFCLEPFLNSDVFRVIDDESALAVIKKQIDQIYQGDASITAGLSITENRVGRTKGQKYETQKAAYAKMKIKQFSNEFNGDLTDEKVLEKICRLKKNHITISTYNKLKAEVREENNRIDKFERKYRFLSNFADCQVEMDGLVYPSTECAYQAAKTLELEVRKEFTKMSAREAKRAGDNPEIVVLRDDWKDVKLQIMRSLLEKKFAQPEFKKLLLDTGDKILIEGTVRNGKAWHDNFWGFCPCPKCKNEVKHNHLGRMLMQIRDELKNE